jgi:uncharacterized repeat protein (TIGR01451 family)/LPXTG-motif cell wall-anchored protein
MILGCTDDAGYVTLRVRAESVGFTVEKQVSEHKKEDWKKEITVNPGDTVDFKISYVNTGQIAQADVMIKDILPENGFLEYINGSAKLLACGFSNAITVSDSIVSSIGMNITQNDARNCIGGSKGWVTFSAKVVDKDKLQCGKNTLVNIGQAITANGTKNDNATVIVNVECEPNECKPGIPEGDERCKEVVIEMCTVEGKTHLRKDDPECKTTTPVLPRTGAAGIVFVAIAVAGLGGGAVYWYKSRETLRAAMAGASGSGKAAKSLRKNGFERTVDRAVNSVKKVFKKNK